MKGIIAIGISPFIFTFMFFTSLLLTCYFNGMAQNWLYTLHTWQAILSICGASALFGVMIACMLRECADREAK